MADNVPDNNPFGRDEDEDELEDIIEGGIAVNHHGEGDTARNASGADLTLFLLCVEDLEEDFPAHPVLRKDVSVQIGLDKNTKFQAVMQRYVDVCNEAFPEAQVRIQDLEFVHVTILKGNETPEVAALMKNDRVAVRKNKTEFRKKEEEQKRAQRELDILFFEQCRSLLSSGDLVLDCQGTVGNQEVLSRNVRCHSAMIRKRCPWLAKQIDLAIRQAQGAIQEGPHDVDDDEENDLHVHGIDLREEPQEQNQIVNSIESDDDQTEGERKMHATEAKTLVPLQHSPQAVKVLLEYCYTNRVIQLGYEAFIKASKLDSENDEVSMSPLARRDWPGQAYPQVSFEIAVAATQLAIEATIPRLALMCQVAASLLVGRHTAVEALTFCQNINSNFGQELTFLRRAAMECIVRYKILLQPSFNKILRGNAELVPLLLQGTKDLVGPALEKREESHDWQTIAFHAFRRHDRDDKATREHERRKRRLERGLGSLKGLESVDDNDDCMSWGSIESLERKIRKRKRRGGFSSREAAADLQREYIRTTQK